MSRLGDLIRTERIRQKMTPKQVAKKCGVSESYLWRERERAYACETTPDCRTHCNACGANTLIGRKCDG